MKALKKLTATFSISSLMMISTPSTFANYSGCELPEPTPPAVCKMIKAKEGVISAKKETLDNLRELQEHLLSGKVIQQKIQNGEELSEDEQLAHDLALVVEGNEDQVEAAQRVSNRILSAEDEFEVMNVESQVREEIEAISQNNNTQITKGAASLGGIVLFSLIIKKMMKSTRGQSLKRRLIAQIWSQDKKIIKTGINIGLVFSIAMGVFAGIKLFENYKEQATLNDMIKLLNQVKDQASNILTIKEELDEMEACYWLQMDQLLEKNLAKESESGLMCL